MHPAHAAAAQVCCPSMALPGYTDTGLLISRDLGKIITFHLCKAIIKACSNFMLLSVSV